MEFVVERDVLQEALGVALAAAPSRTPKDILKNVKLTAEADKLHLLASDGEIALKTSIQVEVIKPGSCLVNGKLLSICREGTGEKVSLYVKKEKVEVECGFANWTLQTGDPDEFQEFPASVGETVIDLPLDRLKFAINLTSFCCDVDSARYALGGVNFSLVDGLLDLAATDSRRLSVVSVCEAVGDIGMTVVPQKACMLVSKMHGESVNVSFGTNAIRFTGDGWQVTSRLVEGRFPMYREVIPKDFSQFGVDLLIPVETLARAVRQSQIVCEKDRASVDFSFHDGNLELTALEAEVGSSKTVIPVSHEGEKVVVSLDSRYVLDLLKRLPGDETLDLKASPDVASIWTCANVTYVLMPLSNEGR